MSVINGIGSSASTVAERVHELLRAHFEDGVLWEDIEEEMRGLVFQVGHDPWSPPEPDPEPEQEWASVGSFVSEYDGSSVELHANCSSRVMLDSDGRLVFRGEDCAGDEAMAVIHIDLLIERVTRLRDQYDDAHSAWMSSNES